MNRSEQTNELAAALAAAQAKIRGAVRDSENPYFRSAYADLQSVWEACREPLASNGLAVVQCPARDGDAVSVETTLLHASGQWVSCILSAVPAKQDAQGVGSVISYLRRYSLAAMVGVYQIDDDAEGAVGRSPTTTIPARERERKQAAAQKRADAESIPAAASAQAGEKKTLRGLWARAQRLGVDEETWRQMLAQCGIARARETHSADRIALLDDLLDQREGINADVPDKPTAQDKIREQVVTVLRAAFGGKDDIIEDVKKHLPADRKESVTMLCDVTTEELKKIAEEL